MSLESPSPSAVIFSFNFDVTVMKSSPARLVDRHCIQPQLPSCEWWIRNHSFSLLPTKQKKTNSQLAFFSPCIDVTWLGSTLSSARKIVPPPPKKIQVNITSITFKPTYLQQLWANSQVPFSFKRGLAFHKDQSYYSEAKYILSIFINLKMSL